MFRVKEWNHAYDQIPAGDPVWVYDRYHPERSGWQNDWIPGPGWIFCTNQMNLLEACIKAVNHPYGYKTEIVYVGQKLLSYAQN